MKLMNTVLVVVLVIGVEPIWYCYRGIFGAEYRNCTCSSCGVH